MHFSTFWAFTATTVAVFAAPAPAHVVHEKRDLTPPGWERSHKLPSHAVLPMRFGLTQSNLEHIEEYLMDVSDPDSPNFGNHWDVEAVAHTFAPSKDTVDAVRDWLISSGITANRIVHEAASGWLKLNATTAEVESLLKTEYHVYEHTNSGTRQIACMDYKVPEAIRKHVDFITPTVAFDAQIQPPKLRKRSADPKKYTVTDIQPIAKQGQTFTSMASLKGRYKNCTDYITPACLRALYNIPVPTTNSQQDPLGIVEYTTQSYYQPDLDMFFNTFSPKQKQRTPNLASIDGGFISDVSLGFGGNGESNLDLQYSMSLVNPITVTVYQVGDAVEGGSFNTFLDAIDASYCKFEGGDSPYDPKYPDPYTNYAGAYEGPLNCGGFAAPKVISTSYAYGTEYELPIFYQQRQCAEYAKLGLMGTSIMYSSGDSGVGLDGESSLCLNPNSTFGNAEELDNGRFVVSFPAACPYVTGVGATQVKPRTSILAMNPEMAANVPLPQGGDTVYQFASGGGFSDLYTVPKWQKNAVQTYLKDYPPPYASFRFNNSGMSRGVPDVSANGAYYIISVNNTFSEVFGTSASSPTFASIISIINEQRSLQGKGSVGFLNPVLYKNPSMFTDITAGNNPGCGTGGFEAQPGWDPLTGLGTPNAAAMLSYFLKLPGKVTYGYRK